MAKFLVVGGGPAGCASAHFLTRAGHQVDLIERSDVLGGSSRTFYFGGHPYHIGPRHFLTKQERVWEYLNAHLPMKRYQGHEFLTYVEQDYNVPVDPGTNTGGGFWHFPIHADEVSHMPDHELIEEELAAAPGPDLARNLEEYWLSSVGLTLYNKFVRDYSDKMWAGAENTEITDFGFTPKGVALKRGPIRAAWSESMSGFPRAIDGYDSYWRIATAEATVHYGVNIQWFDFERRKVQIEGGWHGPWDQFVITISPEDVFDGQLGALRWMGRKFDPIVLPAWHLPDRCVFPPHVFFLYYAGAAPPKGRQSFTRIVEYKKFFEWDMPSGTTLIGVERPCKPSKDNKLYPYPMMRDQDLAAAYHALAPECVHWMGRNGKYRYLDFGNILEDCFALMEKLA
jgi:UDP-galactopyranose mutase